MVVQWVVQLAVEWGEDATTLPAYRWQPKYAMLLCVNSEDRMLFILPPSTGMENVGNFVPRK